MEVQAQPVSNVSQSYELSRGLGVGRSLHLKTSVS